jgi:hypothetical protein
MALEAAQRYKFPNLESGGEGCFYLEYNYATKWCICPMAPSRVRTTIACRKFMVIWGGTGSCVVDLMTTQKTFDSEYFFQQITIPLADKIHPGRRNPHAPGIQVHLDNCHMYFSKVIQCFVEACNLVHVAHPA